MTPTDRPQIFRCSVTVWLRAIDKRNVTDFHLILFSSNLYKTAPCFNYQQQISAEVFSGAGVSFKCSQCTSFGKMEKRASGEGGRSILDSTRINCFDHFAFTRTSISCSTSSLYSAHITLHFRLYFPGLLPTTKNSILLFAL